MCVNMASTGRSTIAAMQHPILIATNGGEANGNGTARLLEGLLSSLPLFQQVPRTSVGMIASHSRIQYVRRGAAICRRSERLPGVIAMGYGIAKLALRRPGSGEKVVEFLGASETFGESTALLDLPCPVDVVALEDSMIAVVSAAPLQRLIERDPRFADNMMRAMAGKFLDLLAELESSLQQSALQRLAAYLASLAKPNDGSSGAIVRLPASKTAVAARLGITKETISRLLRELAEQGLIRVAGREILILDRSSLAKIFR